MMDKTLEQLPGILGRMIPSGLSKEDRFLHVLAASTTLSRARYAYQLGKSFGQDRDLYETLGYPKQLNFEHYYTRYDRQDIAKRVVVAKPNACWRKRPIITDDQSNKEETPFEEAWNDLVRERSIFNYMARIDRLSGIGEFGVLFMGFDDVRVNEDLQNEVQKGNGRQLLYLRPYKQDTVGIHSYEDDLTNPRYGMPKLYQLKASTTVSGVMSASISYLVHWSRVLHVAEGLEEDDILGTPRLKAIYNRLQDIELISGGSAEMFWRGAFPGLNFNIDADAEISPAMMETMTTDIEDYVHKLKRYTRTKGMDVNTLAVQIADPSGHLDLQIALISAETCIPKRILVGSERGELASTQDERQWNRLIDDRRTDYCDVKILRVFVDRMIAYGVLPEPNAGQYDTIWPDIEAPDDKEVAEIAELKTKTIAAYVSGGVSSIIPPDIFLTRVLDFDRAEVDDWISAAENNMEAELEKERQMIEEYERNQIDEGDDDEGNNRR